MMNGATCGAPLTWRLRIVSSLAISPSIRFIVPLVLNVAFCPLSRLRRYPERLIRSSSRCCSSAVSEPVGLVLQVHVATLLEGLDGVPVRPGRPCAPARDRIREVQ